MTTINMEEDFFMRREIDYLVVHCTATASSATPSEIQQYWRNVLGWGNPGYHILIDAQGRRHCLLGDEDPANALCGYNQQSLQVGYIGGLDGKDTRTDGQKEALLQVLQTWKASYPHAQIVGYCDFPHTAGPSPCFDVQEEYAALTAVTTR